MNLINVQKLNIKKILYWQFSSSEWTFTMNADIDQLKWINNVHLNERYTFMKIHVNVSITEQIVTLTFI